MCRSSLRRHDLTGSICSAFGTYFSASRADFGESAPPTVLIAVSTLKLFRCPERALSSTLQSFL